MSTLTRRLPRFPSQDCDSGHFAAILLCWQWDFDTLLAHFSKRKRIDSAHGSRKIKLFDLTVRQGVGNRRGSGRQAEAFEYLVNCHGRMDRAEDPHATAASGAGQNVDRKNPSHELSPRIISGPASAFLLKIFGEDLLFCRTAGVGTEVGDFRLRLRWNYEWSPGRRGREYPVISNQIEARRRHKCSEFFNQFEGLENHVGGSVPPAALEAIQQPTVGQKRQSLGRHRRATGGVRVAWKLQRADSGHPRCHFRNPGIYQEHGF